jgi:hypothetical protein
LRAKSARPSPLHAPSWSPIISTWHSHGRVGRRRRGDRRLERLALDRGMGRPNRSMTRSAAVSPLRGGRRGGAGSAPDLELARRERVVSKRSSGRSCRARPGPGSRRRASAPRRTRLRSRARSRRRGRAPGGPPGSE